MMELAFAIFAVFALMFLNGIESSLRRIATQLEKPQNFNLYYHPESAKGEK